MPSLVPRSGSVIPTVLGVLIRSWAASWTVRRCGVDALEGLLAGGPVVLAFWHEDLAVLGPLHADRGWVGMVSRSRDGQRLAMVLETLGYETVRGSSSNFARSVARAGLRALRSGRSLAIAVDGPRGPRRVVSPGAQTLARWAGVPLVLVGCEAAPALRLPSWDGQRLPAPLARVVVRYEVFGDGADLGARLDALGATGPSAPEF